MFIEFTAKKDYNGWLNGVNITVKKGGKYALRVEDYEKVKKDIAEK